MSFSPSKYQQAIFDFVLNSSGNAVINATAGSGKSTTIIKALELIPKGNKAMFLAFNKAIVEDLKTKVPKGVDVKTLHGCGWSGMMRIFNRPQLNNNKVSATIWEYMKQWSSQEGVELDSDYSGRVKRLVDLIRIDLVQNIEELEELATKHGVEVMNGECERAFIILEVINRNKREFDFVDMLYIAATDDRVTFEQPDWLFIDECQDLNKAQQALVKKLMKPTTRFIAVGDPHQAIYGFAGADVESFNNLALMPNTIKLPLSVNYRCGSDIIKLAQGIVPQIEAHDGAVLGKVDENASYKLIQDGDFVLCRNTAPLVKLCLQFIKEGKKAFVKGGDIGKNLINIVKKTKKSDLDEVMQSLSEELSKIYNKLKKKHPYSTPQELESENAFHLFQEKKLVISTIINNNEKVLNAADLINCLENIFSDTKQGICFSSIHKAKGLESKNVFIIERELMPSKYARKPWQKEQEKNLTYVAYTRAKEYLGFVSDWSFKEGSDNYEEAKAALDNDYSMSDLADVDNKDTKLDDFNS